MKIFGNSNSKDKTGQPFCFSKPVNNRDISPRTSSGGGVLLSELSNHSDGVNDSARHGPSGRPKQKMSLLLIRNNATEIITLAASLKQVKAP